MQGDTTRASEPPSLAARARRLGRRANLAFGLAPVLGSLFLVVAASAAPGDLLWQREIINVTDGSSVVASGNRLFIAGFTQDQTGTADDTFFVRAYQVRSGRLIWESVFPGVSFESPQIATLGHLVFVTVDSRIRAHDVNTGSLIWECAADDIDGAVILDHIEAAAGLVVASGYKVVPVTGLPRRSTNVDFVVRAHNAADGRLLWEDQFDRDNDALTDDYALAVAVQPGRVFVAGQSCSFNSGSCSAIVRAYRARNGTLLWSRASSASSAAYAIASSAGVHRSPALIVIAGVSDRSSTGGPARGIVQAYDAENGTLAWEREQEVRNDDSDSYGFYDAVAVQGERVFVGGSDGRSLVQAYDLRHGDPLWQSVTSRDGSTQALRVSRGQVFAVGTDYELDPSDRLLPRWAVRALDGETGTLLWDDEVAEATIVGIARDDEVERRRLFVIGFAVVRSDGDTLGCTADDSQLCGIAALLRAYDARAPRGVH